MKKSLLFSLVVLVLLGAGQAFGAEKATLIKISNGINEKHPTYLACVKFGELLAQRLPGKYKVEVYANSQLGDDVRATESVRMGTLEAVATSASPLAGLVPKLMALDLPFLFPNEKAADAIFDGKIGAKMGADLEAKGLKILAFYENGFRQLTNSARDVHAPADLKGLKIRTMENPIHLATWKALGANPTPMPFSEVFTAMQQKTIDGQENPIPTIYLSKFYEVQKYTTLTGHVYGPHILLINKRLFDSFPAADQRVILEVAQESAIYQRALNRKMNDEYVESLRKSGMTVTVLTQAEQAAFQKVVSPVYDQFAPKIGADFLAEVKAAIEAAK